MSAEVRHRALELASRICTDADETIRVAVAYTDYILNNVAPAKAPKKPPKKPDRKGEKFTL